MSLKRSGMILCLLLTACASSSPKTGPSTRTSFEPGVKPEAETSGPPTAPAQTVDGVQVGDAKASTPAVPDAAPAPAVQAAKESYAAQDAAAAAPQPSPNAIDPVPVATNEVADLKGRVQNLEEQITTLKGQLDKERLKPKKVAAIPHPAEPFGDDVEEQSPSRRETDAGFLNDAPVRGYRQAMILFLSHRYPDAILAFSQFLKSYAEHPLAGSAQFYVGESYFRQKEYRFAAQEYQRVLTAYDRSPQVASALARLAASQDQLQAKEEAARSRQLLTTLFPMSPAADPHSQPSAPQETVAETPPPPAADASAELHQGSPSP